MTVQGRIVQLFLCVAMLFLLVIYASMARAKLKKLRWIGELSGTLLKWLFYHFPLPEMQSFSNNGKRIQRTTGGKSNPSPRSDSAPPPHGQKQPSQVLIQDLNKRGEVEGNGLVWCYVKYPQFTENGQPHPLAGKPHGKVGDSGICHHCTSTKARKFAETLEARTFKQYGG